MAPWAEGGDTYRALHELGRCMILQTEINGKPMAIANVYGATGGHGCTEAAQKTDMIIDAVLEEFRFGDNVKETETQSDVLNSEKDKATHF